MTRWAVVIMVIQDLNCCKFLIQIKTHHLLTTLSIYQLTCQMRFSSVLPIMSKIFQNHCWTEWKRLSCQVTQTSKKYKFLIFIWYVEPLKKLESSLTSLFFNKESFMHWFKIIAWASLESDTYRKISQEYWKKLHTRL